MENRMPTRVTASRTRSWNRLRNARVKVIATRYTSSAAPGLAPRWLSSLTAQPGPGLPLARANDDRDPLDPACCELYREFDRGLRPIAKTVKAAAKLMPGVCHILPCSEPSRGRCRIFSASRPQVRD